MKLNTNNGINTINNGMENGGNNMENSKNNINTIKMKKGVLEIRNEQIAHGRIISGLYWNDQKIGVMGYTNEDDRIAQLEALRTVLENSDSLYEAAYKLNEIADLNDNNVEADKEIQIDGTTVYINRQKKEAYLANGEVIADCHEIPGDLPIEAVEAILKTRI
jgi:hypothetical protein